jgi:hypothetical protein
MSALKSSPAAQDPAVTVVPVSTPTSPLSWAAVSFVLEDTIWCDWLYREFDGERIPRPLIGRPSRFGLAYPERLSISPDPADPVQLETYAEALHSAQHLILIVSPTSGKSDTLREHLRVFRAAGGGDRIIALVVKGEPASPSAEPGSPSDQEWLPDWLQGRFEENRFQSAGAAEPLVIDARLGVASLAEARAGVMAALLGVKRETLNELGIVTRPTTSLIEFPSPSRISSVPAPTPSSAAFVEIATAAPTPMPRHSSFGLWVCGFASLVALAILAWWPAARMRSGPRLEVDAHPYAQPRMVTASDPNLPLVEVKPLLDAPLSLPPSGGTKVATGPTDFPTQTIPALSAPGTESPAAANSQTSSTSNARAEQALRRDRLTRLAESRMAEGNSEEALEILGHATDLGRELLEQGDAVAGDFVEHAVLCGRAGTLAEGLSRPAVARTFYESGRRTLQELRVKEALSKEALRVLGDLESRARQLHL